MGQESGWGCAPSRFPAPPHWGHVGSMHTYSVESHWDGKATVAAATVALPPAWNNGNPQYRSVWIPHGPSVVGWESCWGCSPSHFPAPPGDRIGDHRFLKGSPFRQSLVPMGRSGPKHHSPIAGLCCRPVLVGFCIMMQLQTEWCMGPWVGSNGYSARPYPLEGTFEGKVLRGEIPSRRETFERMGGGGLP